MSLAPAPSPVRRYLRLLRPYRRAYAAGFALLLLTNALSLLVPWLVKGAVDALALARGEPPRGDGAVALPGPPAWSYALALAATGVALAVVRTGSRVLFLGNGRRLARDLKTALYERLLRAAPSFYARYPTGELMSRFTSDVMIAQAVAAPGALYASNGLLMFGLAVPYLASIDAGLTFWLLLPYPFLAAVTMAAATRVRGHARAAQEAMSELTTRVHEALAGMEVVRAFTLEEREAGRFAATNEVYLQRSMREATARSAIGVATTLVGGVGTCVILWVGGRRVAEGALSYGDLALFLSVMALVLRPTVYLGWVLSLFQRGLASLDRLEELLAAPPGVEPPAAPRARGPVEGRVTVSGLTFRYPAGPAGGERRLALDDVRLDVAPGQVLGLVGRIGSGKSTLLRAIPRFLEVPPGTVAVDGVPVEEWDLAALRGAIGYVPQDGYVFSLSLGENVAFGRPDAPREELERAVATAELQKDLDQLRAGLETLVGERGVTLSGGQRQRLALARAALVRPRILLLDDALSMVDAETAVAVLRNLRRELPGTTVLVAAHRTATLLGCDEVLVLEAGRVVERGAPRELLARAGSRFAATHERQRLQDDVMGAE